MLKIVDLSDYHSGNPRVPPQTTHHNIKTYFYPVLDDSVDMLVISGDFFHTLLDMNGEAGYTAALIIMELIALAVKHKFLIRVLRGTFSHDRLQNQFFLVDGGDKTLNGDPLVAVFENMAIEHIKSLDLDMMYVPDNLPYDDAFPVIEEMMRQHQLTQVDFMVTHGYYTHLIPEGIKKPATTIFDPKKMGNLVKGVVLNGHVHTPSVYGKIVTVGAFERDRHNEEEAKGFVIVEYDRKSAKVEFVENKGAIIFKTIWTDPKLSHEDAINKFMSEVAETFSERTHIGQHVRVVTDDDILAATIKSLVKSSYPGLTIISRKSTKTKEDIEKINVAQSELPKVTEACLPEMIQEDLAGRDITLSMDIIKEELYGE